MTTIQITKKRPNSELAQSFKEWAIKEAQVRQKKYDYSRTLLDQGLHARAVEYQIAAYRRHRYFIAAIKEYHAYKAFAEAEENK